MKPYRESISKLESVESDIIQTKDQEERLAKLEGTGKNKRKRAEESKDSNKTGDHKGKKGKGNKWRNNKDGPPFKKSYQSKKDQEFTKQVLNVLKQQREHKNKSSDSDHSTGWQRHCYNKEERVYYVLGSSQGDLDCSDSDMSITSTDAKKHLKRYRKQQKKKRKAKH